MKKIITILLLLLSISSNVHASEKINVKFFDEDVNINGIYLDSSTNKTMVPIRQFIELIGGSVEYLPKTAEREAGFIVKKDDITIRMFENSSRAYIMNKSDMTSQDIGVNAINIENINYVPLRFIAEIFGFNVNWTVQDNGAEIQIIK